MTDWTREIRHITVTTQDTNDTIHHNPGCPNTQPPTVPAIKWRHQTIRLPDNKPYTVTRRPRWCRHCKNWETPGGRHTWRPYAACRYLRHDIFFPDEDADADPEAVAVCLGCDVATECLRMALRTQRHSYYDYGVWGGLGRGSRTRLRKVLREWTAAQRHRRR